MHNLIERLARATGPDRELDCSIFVATAPSPFVSYYPDCVLASQGGFAARVEIKDIPKFTESIDAATTLMPQGWCWTGYLEKDGRGDFRVSEYPGDETYMGAGANPAIALCIAALSARE